MTALLLVGLGGALGSMARYGIGLSLPPSTFPYGTLLVNVIGCFSIGLVLPGTERIAVGSPEVRQFVIVGFLGGFTTFSAFGYETIVLTRAGLVLPFVNVAANLLLGLGAVLLGRALVSA